MAGLATIVVKDWQTIRDDILRTFRNGMIQAGLQDPNVTPGSDEYIRATAIARELAVAQSNALFAVEQYMPDRATGDDLARWGTVVGLSKRPAVGSNGNVVLSSSTTTVVPLGAELLDGSGLRYRVTVGGSYADEAEIPIESIDVGKDTLHDANDVLRWVSAPAFAEENALVAAGGLTDGAEAEDDETFRTRILERMANPPSAGNPQHLAELAEESSASVQKAFVYPAIQGPGSVHLAVAGRPSDTVKDRDLPSTIYTNVVDAYVQGKTGLHVDVTTTSVTNQAVDVAIYLTLPSAPTASPPGPGGGWLDGSPWPRLSGLSKVTVTAVTSSTVFTVDSNSVAPTAGVSRIAWLSPYDWTLRTATVVSYTGAGPTYVLTIDTPFVDIAVGCYIWPQCTNQQEYVDAFLAHMALMGPGEKTANATLLVRSYRHPVPQLEWPYSLDARLLRAISDVGDEVLDSSYSYRSATTPTVPAAVTDAPSILTPRHAAFYPTV